MRPPRGSLRSLAAVAANHVPGRVADDGIEAAVGQRLSVFVDEHLRECERPMQKAVIEGRFSYKVQKRVGDARRQRVPTLEEQVHQIAKRSTVRRVATGPKPPCAPQVEYAGVSSKWPLSGMEDRECLFFGPRDRGTLVRLIPQLLSRAHG